MALDIIIQQASIVISAIILFVINVMIARIMGPAVFGEYGYLLSICSIYAILMDGGFKTLIIRRSVAVTKPVLVTRQSTIHLFITSVCGIGLLSFLSIKPTSAFTVISYYALFVMSNFIFFFLKGRGQFVVEGLAKAGLHLMLLIVFLIFLHFGKRSINAVLLSFIIAYIGWYLLIFNKWAEIVTLASWIPGRSIKEFIHFLKEFDFSLYKMTFAFTTIDLFTVFYFRIDIAMIKSIISIDAVADYHAAYRLIEAFIFLITPISHIFFQRTRKMVIARARVVPILLYFFPLVFFAGFILAMMLMLLSPVLMSIIYGSQYLDGIRLLKILSFSMVFIIPNIFMTQLSIAVNSEKYYMILTVVAAGINVLVNFVLLPMMGTPGAAVATIITEGFLFVSIGFVLFLKRESLFQ